MQPDCTLCTLCKSGPYRWVCRGERRMWTKPLVNVTAHPIAHWSASTRPSHPPPPQTRIDPSNHLYSFPFLAFFFLRHGGPGLADPLTPNSDITIHPPTSNTVIPGTDGYIPGRCPAAQLLPKGVIVSIRSYSDSDSPMPIQNPPWHIHTRSRGKEAAVGWRHTRNSPRWCCHVHGVGVSPKHGARFSLDARKLIPWGQWLEGGTAVDIGQPGRKWTTK